MDYVAASLTRSRRLPRDKGSSFFPESPKGFRVEGSLVWGFRGLGFRAFGLRVLGSGCRGLGSDFFILTHNKNPLMLCRLLHKPYKAKYNPYLGSFGSVKQG